MIAPVNFLWKQLNGPQITAFCKAIYQWIKRELNPTLDYFNTFSIGTATDDHLTTIGTLLGIKRPIVSLAAASSFFFTEDKETDNERGFSEFKGGTGGVFADIDVTGMDSKFLGESYYRSLLQSIVSSKGEPGSLILIDDVCTYLFNTYRKDDVLSYQLEHVLENNPDQKVMIGDIIMYIGETKYWDPYTFYIDSIISTLNSYAYNPLPQLMHLFKDSDSISQ